MPMVHTRAAARQDLVNHYEYLVENAGENVAERDRPTRPDKAATLKAAHQAAGLKRVLDERIALADAPDAIWHDAEDVFAEMEARNAR